MDILYKSSPLTFLGLSTTAFMLDDCLVGLSFEEDITNLQTWLQKRTGSKTVEPCSFPPQVKKELQEYLAGSRTDFNVKIRLFGTPFQQRVWEAILKIPYGSVTDYKNIAHALGSRGYRAVGTAVKHNPIPIIVPCHRVLPVDGSLGNYSMGNGPQTKRQLLHIEKLEVM